ncbi:MAG: class I tRNA ligase family protein [Ignavibacteriales bacterium]|nr:class I tRNA ligase family protein [Ignavibacteriales bacterium]
MFGLKLCLDTSHQQKNYSQIKNQPDLWKKYWQDANTKYIAFIGKDNVVFHTIIFPAILMAWNEGEKEQYCLTSKCSGK